VYKEISQYLVCAIFALFPGLPEAAMVHSGMDLSKKRRILSSLNIVDNNFLATNAVATALPQSNILNACPSNPDIQGAVLALVSHQIYI
jgi:hypothetical protein